MAEGVRVVRPLLLSGRDIMRFPAVLMTCCTSDVLHSTVRVLFLLLPPFCQVLIKWVHLSHLPSASVAVGAHAGEVVARHTRGAQVLRARGSTPRE